MSSVPKRRPLTQAIKDLLEAETPFKVGISYAPVDPITGDQIPLPYYVIQPISGGSFSGPEFCAPEADVELWYQVRSSGKRDDQADLLADMAREVLLDRSSGQFVHAITYTGHIVQQRAAVGSPGKLDRVGEIYTVPDTYSFCVTSQP